MFEKRTIIRISTSEIPRVRNNKNILITYSPCKTIVSSISTFLLMALGLGADRARFIEATSRGGVGFILKTEDLPTEAMTN